MDKYEKIIQKINEKKPDITKAIAKAFSSEANFGNIEKYIGMRINRGKIFLFESKQLKTGYAKDIERLIDSINKIVGFNISTYVFNKKKIVKEEVQSVDSNISERCKELYNSNSSLYRNKGIDLKSFNEIYLKDGEEKINELQGLLKKLNKDTKLYNFKNKFSTLKELYYFPIDAKMLESVIKKYNVKDFGELLALRAKLVSLNMPKSSFEEKFCYDIEKDEGNLSVKFKDKAAENAVKIIDNAINNNFIKQIFLKTNTRDLFNEDGCEYTSKNIIRIANLYMHVTNCLGVKTYMNMKGEPANVCIFNDVMLKNNTWSQNDVIMHEFIHVLEEHYIEFDGESIGDKFKALNEALTEYFAKKAVSFYEGSITEIYNEDSKNVDILYDYMMPLIDVLRNSSIWEEIVKSKLNNETMTLIKEIGEVNYNKIGNCFEDFFFLKRNGKDVEEIYCDKLSKIIENIEKKKKVR